MPRSVPGAPGHIGETIEVSKPSFPPGTLVCLYLRRSDEKQDESLDTQRDSATRYCAERGWVIVAEYVDDAISRAEFVRRKGLLAMLRDAQDSAPSRRKRTPRQWQLVVCRDSSRIGGDMLRVSTLLQDLRDAEVSVVYYVSDELVSIDSTTDRLLTTVRSFADETEREKISSRTTEALSKRVREGRVAGSACYGYRIEGSEDHRHYVIDEDQAQVVRRIFDAYIAGTGCRLIARQLNDARVPAPRNAGARSLGLWSRPTVRAILLRERYRGVARHGREQKIYRGGTRVRVARAAEQVIEYETPAIVTAAQWDAVSARMASNPRFAECVTSRGAPSKYFLVGKTRCAACGGAVFGLARGKRPPIYVCGRRRNAGNAVCSNAMAHRVSETDARLVSELVRTLTPKVMIATLRGVREALVAELQTDGSDRARLEKSIKECKLKLKRLTAVAAATDSPEAVIDAIRDRNAELKSLEAELAAAAANTATLTQIEAYEARARELRMPEITPELAREWLTLASGDEPMRMDAEGITGTFEISRVFADPDCDQPRSGLNTERSPLRVPFTLRLRAVA